MENLNLVNTKYAIEMLRNHGVSNGGTLGFHAGWCDIAADQLEAALSLIKELTEENERLRAEIDSLAISEVKECEISQMLVYRIRDKHPAVMAVIADTVRKMKDRLINYESYDNGGGNYVVSVDDIRAVAKEMLEGKDEHKED